MQHSLREMLHLVFERAPYKAEWQAMREGKDPELYRPVSHIEGWVPWIFAMLHMYVFVRTFPWTALIQWLAAIKLAAAAALTRDRRLGAVRRRCTTRLDWYEQRVDRRRRQATAAPCFSAPVCSRPSSPKASRSLGRPCAPPMR
jgi:hypothetical protein